MNEQALEITGKKLYSGITQKIKEKGIDVDPEVMKGFRNYCMRENSCGIMEHSIDEFKQWLNIWDMAQNKEVVFDIEVFDNTGYIEAYDRRGNIKHIFNF